MEANAMRAIVRNRYGSADVLRLDEVPKPAPKDDEVLVKVQAASVNPADWRVMRADPVLIRLMGMGLLRPKHNILGADFAGRVEATGASTMQFQPGDEVFGELSPPQGGWGGFAEYVCARETAVALKPSGLTFEAAAAASLAGLTALQGLRDPGRIQPGQRVLINGASGGVGTFAVQIAKSFGAEVTGVCSTRNLELVRSLGADHVIDYTQEDCTRSGQLYDLIIDAAAYRSISDYKRILSPHGIYVLIGGAPARLFQALLLGPWISMTARKKFCALQSSWRAKANADSVALLKELLESGKVVPVIDRRYTLDQVPEAIRYLETGRARGKVVIIMELPENLSDSLDLLPAVRQSPTGR